MEEFLRFYTLHFRMDDRSRAYGISDHLFAWNALRDAVSIPSSTPFGRGSWLNALTVMYQTMFMRNRAPIMSIPLSEAQQAQKQNCDACNPPLIASFARRMVSCMRRILNRKGIKHSTSTGDHQGTIDFGPKLSLRVSPCRLGLVQWETQ